MTTECERLEADIEKTRDRITRRVDELRGRITPAEFVGQVTSYAREGAVGDFLSNLAREVRDRPLPLLLTAAGIGWLIFSTERSRTLALRQFPVALPPPQPRPGGARPAQAEGAFDEPATMAPAE
jgi:hypothetical protein